jgi:hypothetical protein
MLKKDKLPYSIKTLVSEEVNVALLMARDFEGTTEATILRQALTEWLCNRNYLKHPGLKWKKHLQAQAAETEAA